MRYKVKNVAALQMLLGSWPDRMQVEVDPDIGVSVKTVGELRKVTVWLGHNDAARIQSREHHKSEQGYRSNPRLAETVGRQAKCGHQARLCLMSSTSLILHRASLLARDAHHIHRDFVAGWM
jgi:hypothetical protein